MIERGLYIQDDEPSFYIYKQEVKGRSQVGLMACVSVDDYNNNIIKSMNLPEKKKKRIELIIFIRQRLIQVQYS